MLQKIMLKHIPTFQIIQVATIYQSRSFSVLARDRGTNPSHGRLPTTSRSQFHHDPAATAARGWARFPAHQNRWRCLFCSVRRSSRRSAAHRTTGFVVFCPSCYGDCDRGHRPILRARWVPNLEILAGKLEHQSNHHIAGKSADAKAAAIVRIYRVPFSRPGSRRATYQWPVPRHSSTQWPMKHFCPGRTCARTDSADPCDCDSTRSPRAIGKTMCFR